MGRPRSWTELEDALLARLFRRGKTLAEIRDTLTVRRTTGAIRARTKFLRLYKRKKLGVKRRCLLCRTPFPPRYPGEWWCARCRIEIKIYG